MTARVLHRMELLAQFPEAVASHWFQKHLALLRQYRQADGMYLLPKAALVEKETNWVSGGHMGLGENRRTKDAALVLGSFRAYRLLARLAPET
ncbi:MAG TPA: hypothetical protein DE176_04655 [Clostridiales bacterium]|nr:hypothetical protein [Clostridiales bacterium]